MAREFVSKRVGTRNDRAIRLVCDDNTFRFYWHLDAGDKQSAETYTSEAEAMRAFAAGAVEFEPIS